MNEAQATLTLKWPQAGGQTTEIAPGSTFLDILHGEDPANHKQVLAAFLNNRLVDLRTPIQEAGEARWVDIGCAEGTRTYQRSLIFVLAVAARAAFPDADVSVKYSLGKGLYGEVKKTPPLTAEDVDLLRARMQELIAADHPITHSTVKKEEAVKLFIKHGLWDKVRLFKAYGGDELDVYQLAGQIDHFDGPLVPSTSFLQLFDIAFYESGYLLRFPRTGWASSLPPIVRYPKLFEVFQENENWLHILDVDYVGNLNDIISSGAFSEFVKICEALHGKKMDLITQQILQHPDNPRVVLISGPSSSGKTTFTKRLHINLRVAGRRPAVISLDDYFCDRELTPTDDAGNRDYETIKAIDIPLFNMHILTLLDGREVEVPKYDFGRGRRKKGGRRVQIAKDDFILVEGIHALNEDLTRSIPPELKFKIYASALTQLNIDEHNRIRTTDTRLLRRLVRDHKFRGYSAEQTLARWPSVRAGEEKWIFPFQEEADVMFNSALVYEQAVMKHRAERLLQEISPQQEVFPEAQRVLHFLSFFLAGPENEIPPTSILREFLGRSSFLY